ncbi:hypothetical protein EYF80_029553 [Liparis tanakae]|uniref:Uncharacterized protein n=1 Tax=Liparis tanakae TaxID=230148 RepID=A0A4Z2H2X4_9TELE|nr:hypothetical protein EYF80_029553 [Liparis tanakae]
MELKPPYGVCHHDVADLRRRQQEHGGDAHASDVFVQRLNVRVTHNVSETRSKYTQRSPSPPITTATSISRL